MVRILCVDDSMATRRILRTTLEVMDFDAEVLEAESGPDALALLQREEVHLVLLDWAMPEMTGLEVLRTIRANELFSDIPIIIVTGQTETDKMMDAMTSGAAGYVIKPCEKEDLEAKVLAALEDAGHL